MNRCAHCNLSTVSISDKINLFFSTKNTFACPACKKQSQVKLGPVFVILVFLLWNAIHIGFGFWESEKFRMLSVGALFLALFCLVMFFPLSKVEDK